LISIEYSEVSKVWIFDNLFVFFVPEENQMTCTSWTSNPWKSNATNGIWKHICNDGWITIRQS
jgi:hypothetical protein